MLKMTCLLHMYQNPQYKKHFILETCRIITYLVSPVILTITISSVFFYISCRANKQKSRHIIYLNSFNNTTWFGGVINISTQAHWIIGSINTRETKIFTKPNVIVITSKQMFEVNTVKVTTSQIKYYLMIVKTKML